MKEIKKYKSLHELKLHESTTLPCGISIMRVPGGWLYDMWDYSTDYPKSGVFVPYNKEFSLDEKGEG